jgi:hypothetical protein
MGDSNLGTWKLNLAKPKYDPGPPPTSETVVIEPWETDGIQATTAVVLPDGTSVTGRWSAHYDGKDYKIAGVSDFDTIAYDRVDANTVAFTAKYGGNVSGTGPLSCPIMDRCERSWGRGRMQKVRR